MKLDYTFNNYHGKSWKDPDNILKISRWDFGWIPSGSRQHAVGIPAGSRKDCGWVLGSSSRVHDWIAYIFCFVFHLFFGL